MKSTSGRGTDNRQKGGQPNQNSKRPYQKPTLIEKKRSDLNEAQRTILDQLVKEKKSPNR